jgi:uncharacterized protein (TIGR03083 family)
MADERYPRVRPDHVVEAAELAAAALRPHDRSDWTVPAGDLAWDVEATVVHLVGALVKETLYLASRSTRFIAVSPAKFRGATPAELVRSIVPAAQALANTASASSPGTLAYHSTGMTDAEGYLAMGCSEVLVHTWDACRGLGVDFPGSDDVAAGVLARTFPWVEVRPAEGPWRTLLWAFGRIALEDRPRLDDDGLPGVREPLGDWDGTPPAARRTDVVEWIPEPAGQWRAVYRTWPEDQT